MFCPKCGDKNDEGATFCGNCGNPLTSSPSSAKAFTQESAPPAQTSSPPQQSYPPPTTQTSKSGVLGAILNFLFPGLGYWYLGYRKVLGLHPLLFLIGIWIVEVVILYLIGTLSFVVSLLISFFVAYDAYVKAKGKAGWVSAQLK
jgi:hypothetical protein